MQQIMENLRRHIPVQVSAKSNYRLLHTIKADVAVEIRGYTFLAQYDTRKYCRKEIGKLQFPGTRKFRFSKASVNDFCDLTNSKRN